MSLNPVEPKGIFSCPANPEFTVVIPARDEEAHLPGCLSALHLSALNAWGVDFQSKLQVVVVLNRCVDRTQEIAENAGCEFVSCDAKNLAAIRNAGAACARGRILITVDSDSRVSKGSFAHIEKVMRRSDVIGGGVLIKPERLSLGILLTGLVLLPYVLFERLAAGLFFVRTQDFRAIGGFNEEFVTVEDIDFARRLKAYGRTRGQRFVTLWRSHIVTSCRKFDHFGDWYFLRNPRLTFRLLKGKSQSDGNKVWYDFPR